MRDEVYSDMKISMMDVDSTTGEETLNRHWSILNNIYGEYYSIIDWARSDTNYISTVTGNNINKTEIENFINQGIEALKVKSIYDEKEDNAGTTNINSEIPKIKDASIDPDGYVYNSMLLSTDTGMYTDKYINESRDLSGSTPGTNPSVSRFLIPMVADSDTNEYDGSRGRIQLTVSKAISAETGDDELEYENIGEILIFVAKKYLLENPSFSKLVYDTQMTEIDLNKIINNINAKIA